MKKLTTLILTVVMLVSTSVVNVGAVENYDIINWDAEYETDVVLIVVDAEIDSVSVEDFPLLDLSGVRCLFTGDHAHIWALYLTNEGREEVRNAIDIIHENYSFVNIAEPSYISRDNGDFGDPPCDPRFDMDNDGTASFLDLSYLIRYTAGYEPDERLDLGKADINSDGTVNFKDVRLLLRVFAGYEDEF